MDLPTFGALAALASAATWAVTSLLVRTLSPPFTSVGINAFRSSIAGVLLLDTGVVILEGLDLAAVAPGPYELVCLPLRLAGLDGAPCRALLGRRGRGGATPQRWHALQPAAASRSFGSVGFGESARPPR